MNTLCANAGHEAAKNAGGKYVVSIELAHDTSNRQITFSLTNDIDYVHVMFVNDTATLPAPDRCVLMIEALIEVVVGGLNTGLTGKLVIRVWRQLTLIAMRLSVAAAWPMRSPRAREQAPVRPPVPAKPKTESAYKPLRLPTGHAWLVRLVPEAQTYADQLQSMLMEPEMAALLQTRPGLNRLLRPLYRMLGVKPPLNPAANPTPVPQALPADPIPSLARAMPQNQPTWVQPPPAEPTPHRADPTPIRRPGLA